MTKRIIGEGFAFYDDWAIASSNVGGVRVNGNCVERLAKSGEWFMCYNAGKPIEKILWEENGAIHAVTEDGRIEYANVNLSCNPNKKPPVREYSTSSSKKQTKSSKKKEKESKNDDGWFGPGWWWKWPFKLIWALIKAIFSD